MPKTLRGSILDLFELIGFDTETNYAILRYLDGDYPINYTASVFYENMVKIVKEKEPVNRDND